MDRLTVLTVKIQRMADAGEDDAMGDLRQEVVLEERIVDIIDGQGESGRCEGRGFEANEFWDGHGFFQT